MIRPLRELVAFVREPCLDALERVALRAISRIHAPLDEAVRFLSDRIELREHARIEEEARGGILRDGDWVRVVSISCARCAAEHPPGSIRRIKRFEAEAQASSGGEWVFDEPRTAFCHARGTELILASAAETIFAAAAEEERRRTCARRTTS